MITLLSILGILALIGIVATVAAMLNDGYRPVPTDWARVLERRDDPALDALTHEVAPAPPEAGTASHAGGTVPRRPSARRAHRVRVSASR